MGRWRGRGRWGGEDGEGGTEGETGTSSAYKRLVFVCLSIKLGVQLKLKASVYQRNEIKTERSTFIQQVSYVTFIISN